MYDLVKELQWRGMIHDMMPETDWFLSKNKTSIYIGFDPTADSLHIGSLVPIMLLAHVQKSGNRPIALVGGATGMIGDPTGKSDERNLLDEATLAHNVAGIKNILSRFLDFNSQQEDAPLLLNNYDWIKPFSFIDFAREVGKRITVNYMMAKESVKRRLSDEGNGMSFTEFTYQLIQGYDFYYIHKHYNCNIQMGGADQWGNIVTGTELIRRMNDDHTKAYAITCPLITKADGTKFGKSEGGNIWLSKDKTSVYKFYQFWLNVSDEDVKRFIRIYTFLSQAEIEHLEQQHDQEPHMRLLQKKLAQEVTCYVHSHEEYLMAVHASEVLFGSAPAEALQQLDETTFLSVFEGVPQKEIPRKHLQAGLTIVDALAGKTQFLTSNSEAKRELKQQAIMVNKVRVDEDFILDESSLIGEKYVLLQKGKKNYYIIKSFK